MKLYTFFRSSASYRVRIALNLKGLTYEQVPIHLRRGGREQFTASYNTINALALLPDLVDDERLLTQSFAFMAYLEERHPKPALLPADPADRALVRSMALIIACEIHPIQNLRVLVHLKNNLRKSDDDLNRWSRHWIDLGLSALEQIVVSSSRRSKFCFSDSPTLADICLVPQLANARRFGCDLSVYPTLLQIEKACKALPSFADAAPEKQPDAE